MSHWVRNDFAVRMGLGTDDSPRVHRPRPAILAKVDVDPMTRGMMAVISSTILDEFGGTADISLKYWYRRQNGQSHLVHLFDVKVNEDGDELEIEEIYYRNKPLLGHLPPESQSRPRELILDAIKEINIHLREGGSPKEISKILHEYDIPSIVGEDVILPGQNAEGKFSFKISEIFNPAAQGNLAIANDDVLAQTLIQGEINTLDAHRRLDDPERKTFATNKTTGTTFKGSFRQIRKPGSTEMGISLEPVLQPVDDVARPMQDFLRQQWQHRSGDNDNFVLKAFKFLNQDIYPMGTDMQIRVMGASYKIMDLFRRKRYPTALDIMHEFDLLELFSPVEPPPRKGRFSVVSYLGNGKDEIVEGFGRDLGACKAVCFEKSDDTGRVNREIVILDIGQLLPPQGSGWDGAVPDIIAVLKDTKGIAVTHRHVDHYGGLMILARLGLLKDIKIFGSARDVYVFKNHLRAELPDKTLWPEFKPLEGENILSFDNIKLEYCVDGMEHSTNSNIYRVVGIEDGGKISGSYLFYGDGRRVLRPDFLSRGLRSFGLDRQDTLHDLDLTNAKKPGHCPTEADAEKNLIDLMNCFPEKGILTSIISTNDSRLKTLYRVFNRIQRNFTAVGHNVELSLRAQNIHGVDPEYIEKYEKDNVNRFLKDDATAETETRTAGFIAELETATDPARIFELKEKIESMTMHPVRYKTRGSNEAKNWLSGDLSSVAVILTGTQGNPGEMFSSLYRFAEGWSTLDADRHTAYKIEDPKKWVVIIDQSAIPGNHKHQRQMMDKLIKNRGVHALAVAVDDGFKLFGLNDLQKKEFLKNCIKYNRCHYVDDEGALVVTGAPIHPSGHGYREDIRHIAETANADINHGTHTNDPENTTRFHLDICGESRLRHAGRQFDDTEINQIEMGDTREEAQVTSLGHQHSSIVLFKIVREFGKFFGGTLRAKRVTKLDGESGYGQYGIMGGTGENSFESEVIAVDFAKAARQRVSYPEDKAMPGDAMASEPLSERRYKGVRMPRGIRLDENKRKQIRDCVARMVA